MCMEYCAVKTHIVEIKIAIKKVSNSIQLSNVWILIVRNPANKLNEVKYKRALPSRRIIVFFSDAKGIEKITSLCRYGTEIELSFPLHIFRTATINQNQRFIFVSYYYCYKYENTVTVGLVSSSESSVSCLCVYQL